MPDLRESSPSKLSSGFGGTLSLVLSATYIMVVVSVAAIPTHLFLAMHVLGSGTAGQGFLAWASGWQGTVASLVLVVTVGALATALPLRLGIKAFRKLEP